MGIIFQFVVIFTVLLINDTFGQDSECHQYKRKSFLITTIRKKFVESLEYCDSMGMSLLRTYELEQHNWLGRIAFEIQSKSYWTDATDMFSEGNFTHYDKSPVPFLKWDSGTPNNAKDNEHCVVTLQKANKEIMMNDRPCEEKRRVICESQTLDCSVLSYGKYDLCRSNTCSPSGECHQISNYETICKCDALYTGRRCEQIFPCHQYRQKGFLFVNEKMTFSQAGQYCETIGMSLTRVYDSQHLAWLEKKVNQMNLKRFWIDATDNYLEGTFVHQDKTSLLFQSWNPESLEYSNEDEDCVEASFHDGRLRMNATQCHTENSFVCESINVDCGVIKSTETEVCNSRSCSAYGQCKQISINETKCECDEPYSSKRCDFISQCNDYEDEGFLFVSITKSFTEAMTFCEKLGMTLLRVKNSNHERWLVERASQINLLDFWINSENLSKEGVFLDNENSSLSNMSWNSSDNAHNESRSESCIVITIQNNTTMMENVICKEYHGFICQAPINCSQFENIEEDIEELLTEKEITPNSSDCKEALTTWLPITTEQLVYDLSGFSSCVTYYEKGFLLVKARVSWHFAVSICENVGMKLTKIYDNEHHQWIFHNHAYKFLPSSFPWWIGANDIFREKRFVYLDQTKVRFTRWSAGEPSDNGHQQNCVASRMLLGGFPLWIDYYCDYDFLFICESLSPTCNTSFNRNSKICKSDSCSPYSTCVEEGSKPVCRCHDSHSGEKCDFEIYRVNVELMEQLSKYFKKVIPIIGIVFSLYCVYYFIVTTHFKKFGKKMLLAVSICDVFFLLLELFDRGEYFQMSKSLSIDYNIVCKLWKGLAVVFYCGSLFFQECLCLERFVAVTFPLRVKRICTMKVKAAMLFVGIAIIFFMCAFSVWQYYNMYSNWCTLINNHPAVIVLRFSEIIFQFQQALVLIVSNAIILSILFARNQQGRESQMSRKAIQNIQSMVGLSVITVVTTLPNTIFNVMKLEPRVFYSIDVDINSATTSLLSDIRRVNNALNFVFLFITVNDFRVVMGRLVTCGRWPRK